tara:strand:- start:3053 stop:3430 length:378 start_codon:yes stop_codon:yes gene_type:complete
MSLIAEITFVDSAQSNARFWTWVNNGPVKITLRPNQTLRHHSCCDTDEGWSADSEVWTLRDGVVERELVSDGVDCDGRLTQYHSDECPIQDLHDHEAYEAEDYMVPDWNVVSASQYDQFAQAAGY